MCNERIDELTLFCKEYDGESLYDLGRDISEAIDEKYNHIMQGVPLNDAGFPAGTFTVSITWKNS